MGRGGWLTGLALVTGAVFAVGHAFWLVLPAAMGHLNGLADPRSADVQDVGLAIGAIPTVVVMLPVGLVLYFVCATETSYLATSAAAIALNVAAFRWGRPSPLSRLGPVLGVVAVISLPWTITYEPEVTAAPDHTLHVATQPGRIGGVVKAFHSRFEGTPCHYSLLEWGEDNTFYFQSDCGKAPLFRIYGPAADVERRVWAFNPESGGPARQVSASPNGITHEPRRGDNHKFSVPVTGLTTVPEHLSILKSSPVRSPDGRWVAVVVTRFYHPQDVVVVSK
jgi:hypothetical protein